MIATGIEHSQEGEDHLVKSWYVAFLGRSANGTEELGWVNMLTQGQTEEQVLSQILGTTEFYDRAQTLISTGTSDERYIQALYLLLLDRQGSTAEVATHIPNGSLSSSDLVARALTFLQGTEFRQDQVEGYYNALLNRPSDQIGLDGWVTSSMDLALIRIGFESTTEFYGDAGPA